MFGMTVLDWVQIIGYLVVGFAGGWLARLFFSSAKRARFESPMLGETITELASGDADMALEKLTAFVATNTGDLHAYISMGILYRNKGWFNRAIDVHRRVISRTVSDDAIRYRAARELVLDFEDAGLIDRAIDAMKTVLKLSHARVSDYRILGRLYETAKDWDQAIDAWRRSGDEMIWRKRVGFILAWEGIENRQQGDTKNALKKLKAALKLDSHNPAALLHLAQLRAEEDKLAKSVRLYEQLQADRPDLTGVIADSIEMVMVKTGSEKLTTLYERILESQKSEPRVIVRYAAHQASKGNYQEASEALKRVDISKLSNEMMLRMIETSEKIGDRDLAYSLAKNLVGKVVSSERFGCFMCGELFSF
ncbi:tetratricopeptide repeat protein, partial [bacterium]|nr:tetratricopeptide repeat protein [candidate division CSSED10-310 bacterium]